MNHRYSDERTNEAKDQINSQVAIIKYDFYQMKIHIIFGNIPIESIGKGNLQLQAKIKQMKNHCL